MLPVAFHDLRPEDFPLTIVITEQGGDEVLFLERLSGPGALAIPGFERDVDTLVLFGDRTFRCSTVSYEQRNRMLLIARSYEPKEV